MITLRYLFLYLALRFLIPIASLTGQAVSFTGRGRLMERPQSVYEALYREQGLRFEQSAAGLTLELALIHIEMFIRDRGIKGRRTGGLYHGECVALGMLPMFSPFKKP